jgi:hypothetical protein
LCDAVTDLGVVIDGRLRFDHQVTMVCSRVYATLTAFAEVSEAEEFYEIYKDSNSFWA